MILATSGALKAEDPSAASGCAGSAFRVREVGQFAAPQVPSICSDYRSWKRSLMPLLASHTLDVTSSWNRHELNPLLADQRSGFGMKAATVKFGAVGAFVGVQYLVVKKYPGTAKVFSKMNWATAIVTSSFAIHNYAVR